MLSLKNKTKQNKTKNKKFQSELVVDTCFMEALSIERSREADNVAER